MSAEPQQGPAPVTDDAAGQAADPGRGGAAGSPAQMLQAAVVVRLLLAASPFAARP